MLKWNMKSTENARLVQTQEIMGNKGSCRSQQVEHRGLKSQGRQQ
jgi:hypothetical protein